MESNPLSDCVADQYLTWPYPAPIWDIESWLRTNWEWYDPSHAHRLFWPSSDYKRDMNILIAGCGCNQAAIFAFNNPFAKIVAIDINPAAISHHEVLKQKYKLNNLDLHLLPIEQANDLKLKFDLIVSTGSLHHLSDPNRGITTLAECLRPDGVIAIMVYAKYGRIGVEIMQSVFRDLALRQDKASIAAVKDAISILPKLHPAAAYLGLANDLNSDAGWIDTYLSSRETSYSIDDCIRLVDQAGLVFHDLFFKSPYYPPIQTNNLFYSAVKKLPKHKQWSIIERINSINACHFFTAYHSSHRNKNYDIDFGSSKFLRFIPSFRYRCGIDENQIFRPGLKLNLDPLSLSVVQKMDGQKAIGDILIETSINDTLDIKLDGYSVEYVGELFQALWQSDFIEIKLDSC